MKTLFIIPLLFLLSCGATLRLSNITATPNFSKNYEIDKIYNVNVGDAIILIRNDKTIPAFIVAKDYTPPGLGAGGVCEMPLLKQSNDKRNYYYI